MKKKVYRNKWYAVYWNPHCGIFYGRGYKLRTSCYDAAMEELRAEPETKLLGLFHKFNPPITKENI